MPHCKYCHREIWRPARDEVILNGRDWFCNRSHEKGYRAGKMALRVRLRRWVGFWAIITILGLQTANMVRVAMAHPPDPQHMDWFMSQTNQNGMQCCTGEDSFSITDSEWRIVGDHYEVLIEGEWYKILPHQRAKGPPNTTGMGALWWTKRNGKVHIYCFAPAFLW